uniref:Uncharacterized protein n=1 Tax=Ciona intestinalis TaxID=7719 RepID=F6YJJ7_CIOIN
MLVTPQLSPCFDVLLIPKHESNSDGSCRVITGNPPTSGDPTLPWLVCSETGSNNIGLLWATCVLLRVAATGGDEVFINGATEAVSFPWIRLPPPSGPDDENTGFELPSVLIFTFFSGTASNTSSIGEFLSLVLSPDALLRPRLKASTF